jgi:post-segregation antitoxin (ccd killing protein)
MINPSQKKCEEWLEKNRSALNAYNKRIEGRGVFSDGSRRF